MDSSQNSAIGSFSTHLRARHFERAFFFPPLAAILGGYTHVLCDIRQMKANKSLEDDNCFESGWQQGINQSIIR